MLETVQKSPPTLMPQERLHSPAQPSLDLTPEENLRLLPRKEGASDIVEVPYDESLIPILVALVAQKRLRAAFLLETQEQRHIRDTFAKYVDEPGFWKIMGELQYLRAHEDVSYYDSVYPVSLTGKPELQLPPFKSQIAGKLPELVTLPVANQASMFRASLTKCDEMETFIFPGLEKGGLFAGELHQDPHYVTIHQTVFGSRGMDYVLDPSTESIEVIQTGTTTIFGTEFSHASSPERQVAVASTPASGSPRDLTYGIDQPFF